MLFSGNGLAISAFVVWGLMPLYFQYIPNVDIMEMMAVRILVSIPLVYVLLKAFSIPTSRVWRAMKDKRTVFLCFMAALVNFISLFAFAWAATSGQVLAASLGYFINPIFSIVLGVLFLKDRLSPFQAIAVALSVAGIGCQVVYYGELPWLSLVMGGAFALYGLIKKYLTLDAMSSMMIEMITMVPFAVVILLGHLWSETSVFNSGDSTTMLFYLFAAPVTLLPLVLFSVAVTKTSLVMIGFIQYIEPTLQFLLAVVVFGEPLLEIKIISFSLIWIGLLLCIMDITLSRRIHKVVSN